MVGALAGALRVRFLWGLFLLCELLRFCSLRLIGVRIILRRFGIEHC